MKEGSLCLQAIATSVVDPTMIVANVTSTSKTLFTCSPFTCGHLFAGVILLASLGFSS